MCDKRKNYGDSVLYVYQTMVLYVPDNNPSGLYDFDKYELGHKFRRIRNGEMSTLCNTYFLYCKQSLQFIDGYCTQLLIQ